MRTVFELILKQMLKGRQSALELIEAVASVTPDRVYMRSQVMWEMFRHPDGIALQKTFDSLPAPLRVTLGAAGC